LPATDRRPVVGRGEVGGGAVHGCGLCVCVARSEEEARASCQVCLQDGARETVADLQLQTSPMAQLLLLIITQQLDSHQSKLAARIHAIVGFYISIFKHNICKGLGDPSCSKVSKTPWVTSRISNCINSRNV